MKRDDKIAVCSAHAYRQDTSVSSLLNGTSQTRHKHSITSASLYNFSLLSITHFVNSKPISTQMKEHVEIDHFKRPTEKPEVPSFKRPLRKPRKFWITAAQRPGILSIQEINKLTETAYHQMLVKVKALYATVNEYVFEKDTRQDSTYNASTMHQFICRSLYFELECNFNDTYWVNIRFEQCPFENEIRKLLHCYPLNLRSKYVEAIVSVNEFFVTIKGEFDQACFYTLATATDS